MGQDKWTWGSKLFCHLEILLSAHARTLKVNILHLDQKAAKCTTYYRQWPENGWNSFKTRFSAKFPGPNGMRCSQQNRTKSKCNSQKKSAKEFFCLIFLQRFLFDSVYGVPCSVVFNLVYICTLRWVTCNFDWTRNEWPRKVNILSRRGKIHLSSTNLFQNVPPKLIIW